MFDPLEKFKAGIQEFCGKNENYKTCTTNNQQDAKETGSKKLQEKQVRKKQRN